MDFFKKLGHAKPIIQIPVNWPALLAFAVFWTYGLYASLNFNSLVWEAISSLVLAGIFIIFLALSNKTKQYRSTISLSPQDIYLLLFFVLVILGFGILTVNRSLQGDELYTSRHAQIQFIFILEKLSQYFKTLDRLPFNYALYALDLLGLAAAALGYWFLRNKSLALKIAALAPLFIIFRFGLFFSGSNNDPFPAFRLLPLWLTSSIFSPTAFTFRLGTLLGLIGLMWFLQRQAQKKLPLLNSWLFALAAGTIPILWHVALIIEHSLWAAVCWTILVFIISSYEWDNTADWFGLFSIIALFTLMRQSVFIAVVPVGLMWLLQKLTPPQTETAFFKKLSYYTKQVWQIIKKPKVWLMVLLPILAMLPFTLKSIISGTPATYLPGSAPYIPHQSLAIARIWFAIKSGIAWHAIVNSALPYWLVFLPFGFLPFGKKQIKNSVILLIFFILAFCLFYTIGPALWGFSKYQSEYVIPFIILGFYWVAIKLNNFQPYGQRILSVLFITLTALNIIFLLNLAKFNPPADDIVGQDPQGLVVLAEAPFNYHEALVQAKKSGFAGQTALVGDVNGALNEMLSGYNIGEVKAQESIYATTLGRPDITTINNDKQIQLVLIGDISEAMKIQTQNGLKKLGWKDWKNFTNTKYRSTVVGLVRD